MLPPEFGKGFGLYPNLLETREVIPDYTKRTLGGVIPLEGLEPDERVRELIPHAELMRRVKTTAPFLYSLIRTNPNTKVSTGYVKKGGQWFHDIVLADLITLLSGTEAESRVKHNAHIGISSYDDNNQKTGYKIYEYPDPNIINDTFYLIFEGVTDTGGTEEKIAKMLMSPMYRT